jgi:hypothetical protein
MIDFDKWKHGMVWRFEHLRIKGWSNNYFWGCGDRGDGVWMLGFSFEFTFFKASLKGQQHHYQIGHK